MRQTPISFLCEDQVPPVRVRQHPHYGSKGSEWITAVQFGETSQLTVSLVFCTVTRTAGINAVDKLLQALGDALDEASHLAVDEAAR